MKRLRKSAIAGVMLASFAFVLTISAFGQQEVDPSWYDPWAKPAAVHAPQAKPAIAEHKKSPMASTAKPKARKHTRVAEARRESPRMAMTLATK